MGVVEIAAVTIGNFSLRDVLSALIATEMLGTVEAAKVRTPMSASV